MIEINVGAYGVAVDGHAGYAEKGKDIVCAGVSAITQSVLNWAIQHSEDAEYISYKATDGNFRLYFQPKRRIRREWEAVKETALYGYSAIAAEYPSYVSVE